MKSNLDPENVSPARRTEVRNSPCCQASYTVCSSATTVIGLRCRVMNLHASHYTGKTSKSVRNLEDTTKAEKKEEIEKKKLNQKKKRIVYEEENKKTCQSCGTKSTPCWRPGWDHNLLLCNSCGLRYKKIKLFCDKCFYIPLKNEIGGRNGTTILKCRKCGQE